MRTFSMLAIAALAVGCSNTRDQFFLEQTDAPFIADLGVLEPISEDDLIATQDDMMAHPESIIYSQLGAGEDPGVFGGATFQFAGTGGNVCVVVDPEAMFWNRELSDQASQPYKYDDIYTDDGDLDISVGLTAYYTGSPGEAIGDFEAEYTDPSGVSHQLEFNECVQTGLFGDPAHAGRATVEYCTINTSLRPGIMYTVVLETFSLPIDDNILNFGAMVYDGNCQNLKWTDDEGALQTGASECVLPNEVGNAEPDGVTPDDKAWFPDLERAYCSGKGKVNKLCKDLVGEGCNEPSSYTD